MLITLPMIFAARKLDGEDPNVVYWLRVAYFSIQAVVVMVVAYVYIVSSTAIKGYENRLIYVPQAAQPFGNTDGKKKYTETTFGKHVSSQVLSLLGSTLFGVVLTSGLHFYRGMIVGLAMQSVMGPLNLTDNALIKALVLRGKRKEGSWKPEDKIFEEKTADELTSEDEIIDGSGNAVVLKKKNFEDILLDIWDNGADKEVAPVDITPLMDEINKSNCNFKSKEKGWTPLMVLSGLGVDGCNGCISAIRRVIDMGGNPAIKDSDGWNAMHWAAFHNSVEAAKLLNDNCGSLWLETDIEGKKPVELAKTEGNDDVAKFLQELEPSDDDKKSNDEGLRKRK